MVVNDDDQQACDEDDDDMMHAKDNDDTECDEQVQTSRNFPVRQITASLYEGFRPI